MLCNGKRKQEFLAGQESLPVSVCFLPFGADEYDPVSGCIQISFQDLENESQTWWLPTSQPLKRQSAFLHVLTDFILFLHCVPNGTLFPHRALDKSGAL